MRQSFSELETNKENHEKKQRKNGLFGSLKNVTEGCQKQHVWK